MNASENAAHLRALAFETLVLPSTLGSRVFIDPASCAVRLGKSWIGLWSLLCALTPVAVQVFSTDMLAYCADVHRRFCKLFSHSAAHDLGALRIDMELIESTRSFHLRVESMTVAILTQVPSFACMGNVLSSPVWLGGYEEPVLLVHVDISQALSMMQTGLLRAAFYEALHLCSTPPFPSIYTSCKLQTVTLTNVDIPTPACQRSQLESVTLVNVDIPSRRDAMSKKIQTLQAKIAAIQEDTRAKRALVSLHTRHAKVDIKTSVHHVPSRTLVSVSVQTAAMPPDVVVASTKKAPRKDAAAKAEPPASGFSSNRLAKVCRQIEDRLYSYKPHGTIFENGPTKQELIAGMGSDADDLLEALPKAFIWCARLQRLFERVERECVLGNAVSIAEFAGSAMDVQEEKAHYFQYMFARIVAEPDDKATRSRLMGAGTQGLSSAMLYQKLADDARTMIGPEPMKLLQAVGCTAGVSMDADRLLVLENLVSAAMLQGAKCHADTAGMDFDAETFWATHRNLMHVQSFKFASMLNMCFEFALKHLEVKTYMIVRKSLQMISSGMNMRQCFSMALMCMELKHLLQTTKGLVGFVEWAKKSDAGSQFHSGSFPPISGMFMSFVRERDKKK
jgi:hypothetical protein